MTGSNPTPRPSMRNRDDDTPIECRCGHAYPASYMIEHPSGRLICPDCAKRS